VAERQREKGATCTFASGKKKRWDSLRGGEDGKVGRNSGSRREPISIIPEETSIAWKAMDQLREKKKRGPAKGKRPA